MILVADFAAPCLISFTLCCLCLFQWDEVSVLDDRGKLIRTFEVCNVNQNPRLQDNWLATPFLYRHSAPRVFVMLRFSVRDCASLRTPSPTCRETLTLYYKQADSQTELMRTWVAEVRLNMNSLLHKSRKMSSVCWLICYDAFHMCYNTHAAEVRFLWSIFWQSVIILPLIPLMTFPELQKTRVTGGIRMQTHLSGRNSSLVCFVWYDKN